MTTLTYTVKVSIPGQELQLVENLTYTSVGNNPETEVLNQLLDNIEATLVKMETGSRGVIRIGNKIFVITDEKVPVIEVVTNCLIIT